MIGVGGCAVPNKLCNRIGTPAKGVIESFNHQNAGAFAHHEAVAIPVERTRCALRLIVEVGRERTGCGKRAEADPIDARFRAAANRNISFAGENETRAVADGLYARCASRHRRAKRTLEAVADGDLSRCEIDEKRRYSERRQAANAALVGRAHGVGDGGKSADTRCDDGCCALTRALVLRHPSGLGNRFVSRHQRELDEAIHFFLIFARRGAVDVET